MHVGPFLDSSIAVSTKCRTILGEIGFFREVGLSIDAGILLLAELASIHMAGLLLDSSLIAGGTTREAVVTSVGHKRGEGLVRLSATA